MSIVRIQHDKDKPYVQINKVGLETSSVSWAAKGLWAYLISRPDNWQVSVAHLSKIYTGKQRGNGEKAIRALMSELMKEGYVAKERKRGEEGQFEGINYVVYESKQAPQTENELKKKVPHRLERHAVEPLAVKDALIKNEFIHSLQPEEKPEKEIDKKEANSEKGRSAKDNRNSHFLDIPEVLDFCEQMGIGIKEKDFKIWRSEFTAKQIYDALRLILDETGGMYDDLVLKKPIDNHAAFVNSALHGGWVKERESMTINKKYAEDLKSQGWKGLVITKQYCRCRGSGNDWSFKLSVDDFKREIDHHIFKTKEAYLARKEKCYD